MGMSGKRYLMPKDWFSEVSCGQRDSTNLFTKDCEY